LPHKFEAGTPNAADAVGLAAAVDYLDRIGMERVREHERGLMSAAQRRLEAIDGLQIYGPPASARSGVLSFTMSDVHPHDLATILDGEGVCIRAGHHCAQPLMRRLNLVATARALQDYVRRIEPPRLAVNRLLKGADPILGAYTAVSTYGGIRAGELAAIRRGLQSTLGHHPVLKEGIGDLKVLTDSKAALEVLERVATGTLQPFDDIDSVAECKRILGSARGVNISYEWVRGHNGHPLNELADRLAGLARPGSASSQGKAGPRSTSSWSSFRWIVSRSVVVSSAITAGSSSAPAG